MGLSKNVRCVGREEVEEHLKNFLWARPMKHPAYDNNTPQDTIS